MDRPIVFISKSNTRFPLTRAEAQVSLLVKGMLGEETGEGEIPFPTFPDDVLARVVQYCKLAVHDPMQPIPKPLLDADFDKAVVPAGYLAILKNVHFLDVFHLITAANFFDIPPLLDMCCAKIATMIKGKSVEEIRKTFGITRAMSPEEEAEVRRENPWCEDDVDEVSTTTT